MHVLFQLWMENLRQYKHARVFFYYDCMSLEFEPPTISEVVLIVSSLPMTEQKKYL